jgi:hypothetical protein
VRQLPAGKDMSIEAEEYLLLEAIIRQLLAKTQKTLCVLHYSDL